MVYWQISISETVWRFITQQVVDTTLPAQGPM
jgi:hypothetical protein